MGFCDKDIVVLSGAHTLGRAHPDISDFEKAWTKEPHKFDNSYFVELLKGSSGAEKDGLLKLPTDLALLKDYTTRRFVEIYAENETIFYKDYAAAHKKMSELGYISRPSPCLCRRPTWLTVAAMAAFVAVCYFYGTPIKDKRKCTGVKGSGKSLSGKRAYSW